MLTHSVGFLLTFIDRVLAKEFIISDKSKADVNHICKLVQYFSMYEQSLSITNIMRTHLLFSLLANCHVASARDTLLSLLCPSEQFLRVETQERAILNQYLSITKFFEHLRRQIEKPDFNEVDMVIHQLMDDPQTKMFIAGLDLDSHLPGLKARNVYLNWFHSFFNVKLLQDSRKQPEDIYKNIIDIDGIKEIEQRMNSFQRSNTLNPNGRLGGSANTLGINLGVKSALRRKSTLDLDAEHEEVFGDADPEFHRRLSEEIKNQGQGGISQSNLKDLKLNEEYKSEADEKMIEAEEKSLREESTKQRSSIMFIKRIPRSVLDHALVATPTIKKVQKVVMAIISIHILFRRENTERKLAKRKLKIVNYPEEITAVHEDIRELRGGWMEYFNTCIENETTSFALTQFILSLLKTYHTNQMHFKMNLQMRMFAIKDDNFSRLMFKDEKEKHLSILITLFKQFLIKIEYALSNLLVLQSGLMAGECFNYIISNV